jgi:SAM-dependent methyltransferase
MTSPQSDIRIFESKDYLWLHLRELPFFRALLRAVESRFYEGISLPSPLLDLGCGDGQFSKITFDLPPEVGIDSWWDQLKEAHQRKTYDTVIMADGKEIPFTDGYFQSAISNSVLEHIQHLDDVLLEIARILKPGSPFVFCVPNDNFLPSLSIGKFLDQIGFTKLGNRYRQIFNWISRHHHCDSPKTWKDRLSAAGFSVDKWWHYFSPSALRILEWGHYFGLPSWIINKFTGRWILVDQPWNFLFLRKVLYKYYNEPVEQENGVYTFYLTTRV